MAEAEVFEFVYFNVCGYIEVKSFGGSFYFITIINDISTKVWAYDIKNKSDVFVIFKNFYVLVGRETNKLLKYLTSDNGDKYCFVEFDEYCSKHEIRYEKMVPYTPQYNRVAERMHM